MISLLVYGWWWKWDYNENSKNKTVVLNTQSFSVLDNVRLINVLIIKFNCKCSIHMQRGLPTIYISSRSMRKLEPSLRLLLPNSMFYKITKKV